MKPPTGLRARRGKWHYRVKRGGREWTGNTGYAATSRNVSAALTELTRQRELIRYGRRDDKAVQAKEFKDAADEFLKWSEGEHKDKPNTARRLKTSFASLKQHFDGRAVHLVSSADVERYKTWRRENGIKEVTIRHDLHALSPFFKYAIKAGWCSENAVDHVTIPSAGDAVRDHVVSVREEKAYFAAAEKRSMALHDVARVMIDQGARPDEVMKLRVEDVDWKRGTFKIVSGKTRAAQRVLLMTPKVKEILKRRADGREDGWLFEGKKVGTALSKLNGVHDKVLADAELEFTLYEFRHTFATRFGEAVGDPIALAAILGHANLRTVMKYCHVGEAHAAAAMKKYMAGQGGPKVDRPKAAKSKGKVSRGTTSLTSSS